MNHSDVDDTWQFHDEFVRRWFNPTYVRRLSANRRDSLQEALQLPILPWLEHWLAFAEVPFEQRNWYTMRDDILISRMDTSGIEAVSMLMQAEGDKFWCVKSANWNDENPSVTEFSYWPTDGSDPEGERLFDNGVAAPFLASFALGYQFLYFTPRNLRCESLDWGMNEEWLHKRFGAATRFGCLNIYETDDSLCVRPSSEHYLWGFMHHGLFHR